MAIDATDFKENPRQQYTPEWNSRELNKAYVGFYNDGWVHLWNNTISTLVHEIHPIVCSIVSISLWHTEHEWLKYIFMLTISGNEYEY